MTYELTDRERAYILQAEIVRREEVAAQALIEERKEAFTSYESEALAMTDKELTDNHAAAKAAAAEEVAPA